MAYVIGFQYVNWLSSIRKRKMIKIKNVCPNGIACLLISAAMVTLPSGCSSPPKMKYRQAIMGLTYDFLRMTECQLDTDRQQAYEACERSYSQDFSDYQRMRYDFINESLTN